MSRSFKKTPVCKDGNKKKSNDKSYANRRFRRVKADDEEFNDFYSGKSNRHKKHTDAWTIADYTSRWTLNDAIKEWRSEEAPNYNDWYVRRYGEGFYHHRYKTLENFLNKCWKKWYHRK